MTRNAKLRQICRNYLQRLRYMADKHGLTSWLDQAINDTKRKDCEPTEKECAMLSRLVDDERIARIDIPPLLNKNYRQSIHDEDFEHIEKLPRVGTYSKVSALLYASKICKTKKKNLKKT